MRVLFERGAFTAVDTKATASMLSALAFGLPAYVLIKVLHPSFFAREDTKTPMIYAGITMAANIVLSLTLFLLIGATGIALATTLSGWIHVALLIGKLRERESFTLDRTFRRRFAGIVGASLAMGAVVLVLVRLLEPWFAPQSGLLLQGFALIVLVARGLLGLSRRGSSIRRGPISRFDQRQRALRAWRRGVIRLCCSAILHCSIGRAAPCKAGHAAACSICRARTQRALEKAKTIPADALIFDLEDAVAPDAKALARDQVCAAVKNGGYGGREIVIRVNALETPWGTEDLLAACEAEPDAILVPKVVHSGDIISAAKILQGAHASEKIRLWAMMETPMAILNARTIAATAVYAENRLCCLVMGTNDLIKESRARALHDRFAVVPWLAMTLVAARAYRLDIIDGVYNDFRDELGLREECERGRTLGMDGKTLIHPDQVWPCNEIFSPTREEVEWSRKVIDAFGQPENEHKGVIVVEGRMVERLHFAMAQRTVAIAEQIREMETACV